MREMRPKEHLLVRLADGLMGPAVGAYAFLDDLFLGPIVVGLAVWLPWYVAFGLAAPMLTLVNIASCNWLQRSWESWIQGHGAKLEAKLERLRRSRLLRHPVGWIARESEVWFVIAAGLIGTVIVVGVARLSGGEPVARRTLAFASVAYSAGFAATYTIVGLGIGDLLRVV